MFHLDLLHVQGDLFDQSFCVSVAAAFWVTDSSGGASLWLRQIGLPVFARDLASPTDSVVDFSLHRTIRWVLSV